MGTTCICHVEFIGPRGHPFYLGPLQLSKNYHLFAALAGVRNGTWGMNLRPVSPPKGLPENTSPEIREESAKMASYTYGHSWLTAKELLDYDWHQQVHHKAVADSATPGFKEWLEKGDRSAPPPGTGHSISGKDGVPATVRDVEWTRTLAVDVKDFLDGVLPYVKYLGTGYLPESLDKVRIVFWFKD